MPFLHPPRIVVDLLFDCIGLCQILQTLVLVGFHRTVIQLVKQGLQLADLVFRVIGELLMGFGKGDGILHDVLRVVSDPFQVADVPVRAGEVNPVFLSQAAFRTQAHDETDQLAVDEIEPPLVPLEELFFRELQLRGHLQASVHVQQGGLGHVQDFALDLRNRHRRSPEHVFIDIAKGELGVLHHRLVRNHPGHETHQGTRQREHHRHRHRVEEGMEHGELGLGGGREQLVEQASVGDAEAAQHRRREHEEHHAGNVEEQVDEGGPLGVGPAGDTGNDRHDAGTDVGTHREIDTLVDADKARHHHGEGDGGHHRGTLDDGREQGAEQHQQERVADSGEEGLDPLKGCKRLHGSAHQFQTHEQESETGQDAAQDLDAALLGEETQECTQSRKGGKDNAGRDGVPAEHTQGHDLRGHRRTDIGPVDDGGGLGQGDDTGIDEADGHDRRRTGTLDGGRSERTDPDAQEFAAGGLGEELFEFFRARRLQVGTHHLTRDEEYADSREQCQQRRNDNRQVHKMH